MPDANLIKLVRKTLVEAVRASAGGKVFQHIYVRDKRTGRELDTMRGGELSCAFFVSGMLAIFGLIDRAHATATTTLQKMQQAGWYKIDAPKAGAVAHWPEYEGHDHLGFCVGPDEFVSNRLSKRVPDIHKTALSDGRTPDSYYWHDAFNQD